MMTLEQLKTYLLNKPQSTLAFPFGDDVFVFKVATKMFSLIAYKEGVMRMNLKCDPDEALALRDIFSAVIPGYHMNKQHWNTVIFDGSIPQGEIERMIDNSFMLVVSKMTKKDQQSILVHL